MWHALISKKKSSLEQLSCSSLGARCNRCQSSTQPAPLLIHKMICTVKLIAAEELNRAETKCYRYKIRPLTTSLKCIKLSGVLATNGQLGTRMGLSVPTPDRLSFVFSRSSERTKKRVRCRYTIHRSGYVFIVRNHAVYQCIRQYD